MNRKNTLLEFITISNNIHNFNYLYDDVLYENNKTPVKILCRKHGYFNQRPDSHMRGIGCKLCGEEKFKITQRKKIDLAIVDFNKYHNFNFEYDVTTYKNAHTKMKIFCKKCKNWFSQTPNTHLRCGCPICNESKGEKNISNFLCENNILFDRQKSFTGCIYKSKLYFDFYLPDFNICIEFDGEQHYIPIEFFGGNKNLSVVKIRDNIKNIFCKENNINLIRIRYDENMYEKLNFLKINKNE